MSRSQAIHVHPSHALCVAVISIDLACILQSHHVETTTVLMVVNVWRKMETVYASVKTHSMANTACTTQNVSDF